jgi:phage nucleotide-binding protein
MSDFEIKNTSEAHTDGIKILLFGESGIGKTTQLGTMAGKTLVLSAEGGLLVLKDKKIDVIDILDIATLGKAYLAIRDGKLKYDNICIDSLTEIGEMIVSELEDDEYFGNPSNTFPKWQEYTKKMIKMVKMFRDLKGVNIIFSALRESSEANGSVVYMPQIPAKKAQSKLVSLFDEVYYINVNNDGERVLHTNSTSTYVGKTRAGIPTGQVISDTVNIGSILKSITTKK